MDTSKEYREMRVGVYKKTLWPAALAMSAILLGFGWRLGSSRQASIVVLLVIGAMGFVPLILEHRRCIIITRDELISKARTGAAIRIVFAEVAEVKETTALWSASRIPAVEFTLVTGQHSVVPLDFRGHDEILRTIREMVSAQST
jgi:hypothetical protein